MRATSIQLGGYEYAVEYDGPYISLTRYMSECIGCQHYDVDCRETTEGGDVECFAEITMPDTYDFKEPLEADNYPELTAGELDMLNEMLNKHNKYTENRS